ncbi:hypothetical protein Q8A67_023856 [Cirrhinus molitorella]|uniref:Uncharacterized protein n=1 Tax=Cirrhinus molitorella TaxID=172907 RepID=A0AA88TLC2_9TELE|nr:hypothetical protein Q8A67_023856 [Cirrhinus molitorella]
MPMAEEPALTHQAPPFPHPSSPAALSPNLPPPQEGGLCINIYELRNWTLYPLPMTRTLAHTTQLLFSNPPILGDIGRPPLRGGGRGGVWGCWRRDILDSLPSVRLTGPVQTPSSEQQGAHMVFVTAETRARGIGLATKICFCLYLMEGPLEDGPLQD